MSTTLVDTFVYPQPHQIGVKEKCHLEPGLSVSLVSPPIPYPMSSEERCAVQLAHLASQHHGSEYNRIKFGPQGCPMAYVPLSIHMPDYVKELQARQNIYTEQKAWWPCQKQDVKPTHSSESDGPPVLGPCGSSIPSSIDLQQAIQAAIAAPLESNPQNTNLPQNSQLKTSDTHPINISFIIPQELIPIISSHITPTRKPSPTVFDIHPAYSLDRVSTSQPFSSPSSRSLSLDRLPTYGRHSLPITANMAPPLTHWRSRSSVTEAIQAAINSGLAAAARDFMTPVLSTTMSNVALGSYSIHPTVRSVHPTKRTPKSCQQTLISPNEDNEHERAYSAPPIMLDFPTSAARSNSLSRLRGTSSHTSRCRSDQLAIPVSSSTRIPNSSISKHNQTTSIPRSFSQHTRSNPPKIILGNILLSSCPGKKVRLAGPVKGRSGVCRDLAIDLKRMRDLGVECVICCLDDSELEFLGVPWPEYSLTAQEVGIDVLRIPIPEGLTPTSPSSLDVHLTRVIKTYTLQGIPILAHCRGGVGRAGLVACCWMLKLGLCGWIETDLRYHSKRNTSGGWTKDLVAMNAECGVRRDTLQLVERVIGIVRKRRSVKAVETYEQVKFLVDYVEYLRDNLTSHEVRL